MEMGIGSGSTTSAAPHLEVAAAGAERGLAAGEVGLAPLQVQLPLRHLLVPGGGGRPAGGLGLPRVDRRHARLKRGGAACGWG